MASWKDFADAEPEMAAAGLQLLGHGIAYLATVRQDGAPRVHPVAPVLADGRIFVAIPNTSPKARDLLRDGRYAMHGLPGKRDDELMLRGRAVLVEDADTRTLVSDSAGHVIRDHDHIFEFHLDRALWGYWEHVGQPNTFPIRKWWAAPGVRA